MSLQLTFDGGEVIMKRDLGSPGMIQGFVSEEIVVNKNDTPLATNFFFQTQKFVQFSLASLENTQVWIKVAGVWRQAKAWIKVAGVWKEATPWIKISGNWR